MSRLPFASTLFALTLSAAALGSAQAAECKASVESNDAMQFNTKALSVPASCKSFSITLHHVGKLPKAAMGHNLVVAKSADMAGIASDGIAAGVAQDYVKPGDARIIAHTKLIGGGESTTVELPVAQLKAGTDYAFFCSFPGHSALMKGSIKLER